MRGDLSTAVSRASVTLGFSHQTPPSDPRECSGDGGWRVRLATALADTLSGAGERLGEFTPNDLILSGGDWMPTLEISTDGDLFREGIVKFSVPKLDDEDPDAIGKLADIAARHLTALSELRPFLKEQLEQVRQRIVAETHQCGAFCIRDVRFEEMRIVPATDPGTDPGSGQPDIILYADVAYDMASCDNRTLRDSCPVKMTLGGSANLSILHKRLGRSGCAHAANCNCACHH